MCVCRIVLQNVYINIQKNRIIILIFPMYPSYLLMEFVSPLKNEVDDTVPKEPTIDMFLKTICEKNGANVLTLC